MKRMFNPIKILIVLFLLGYASYVLAQQEIVIKKYDKEKQSFEEQITLAKAKNEEYKKFSEYIKTDEYIEKVAREKLGMLFPQERIYIEYNS